MTLQEAISARHSVRQYLAKAVEAETAVNQQKFEFTLNADGTAEVKTKFSIVGYTHIDLGIVMCHFEIASGKKL